MNENIFWILTAKIKEGQTEDLKKLIVEMTDYTKANESGTLNFEWFISSDEKFCHIYEKYEHSEATVNHLKNFSANFAPKFMNCLEIKSFTVYGKPSEEVIKMMTPLGVKFMEPAGGFIR